MYACEYANYELIDYLISCKVNTGLNTKQKEHVFKAIAENENLSKTELAKILQYFH